VSPSPIRGAAKGIGSSFRTTPRSCLILGPRLGLELASQPGLACSPRNLALRVQVLPLAPRGGRAGWTSRPACLGAAGQKAAVESIKHTAFRKPSPPRQPDPTPAPDTPGPPRRPPIRSPHIHPDCHHTAGRCGRGGVRGAGLTLFKRPPRFPGSRLWLITSWLVRNRPHAAGPPTLSTPRAPIYRGFHRRIEFPRHLQTPVCRFRLLPGPATCAPRPRPWRVGWLGRTVGAWLGDDAQALSVRVCCPLWLGAM